MADISEQLQDILRATYGEEVRNAIYNALVAINAETEAATSIAQQALNKADAKDTANIGKSTDQSREDGTLWGRVNWIMYYMGNRNDSERSTPDFIFPYLKYLSNMVGTPGRAGTSGNRTGTVNQKLEYILYYYGDPNDSTLYNNVNNVFGYLKYLKSTIGDPSDQANETGNLQAKMKWVVSQIGIPNASTVSVPTSGNIYDRIRWLYASLGTSTNAIDKNGATVWSRTRYAVSRADEAYALASSK